VTIEMVESTFRTWFMEPLEVLYEMQAGFPIMLVILPILERFLREVSGVAEGSLDDDFFDVLIELFPALKSRDLARRFWQTYRNGLLHQLSFSLRDRRGRAMPSACITFDQEEAVLVHEEDQVSVNPISFGKLVTEVILDDYEVMAGEASPNHPLPFVFPPNSSFNMTGTACDDRWRK